MPGEIYGLPTSLTCTAVQGGPVEHLSGKSVTVMTMRMDDVGDDDELTVMTMRMDDVGDDDELCVCDDVEHRP